jgi:hypothetical protein
VILPADNFLHLFQPVEPTADRQSSVGHPIIKRAKSHLLKFNALYGIYIYYHIELASSVNYY